eukprot:6744862-Ditylum_brightwellii.AAC.1
MSQCQVTSQHSAKIQSSRSTTSTTLPISSTAATMRNRSPNLAFCQHLPQDKRKANKKVQQIVGDLLYYSQGVDSTIAKALNSIGQQQNTATDQTEKYTHQLLDYMATNL